MPLQNRVDPWGHILAVSDRGTRMGNRGKLRAVDGRIVKEWSNTRWINCLTDLPPPIEPVQYTKLFFLDEATAYAAGHRPCNDCQPKLHKDFKRAWLKANPDKVNGRNPGITEIDRVLHEERITPAGEKICFEADWSDLPQGSFFEYDGRALLVWKGRLLIWSFAGYSPAEVRLSAHEKVKVLTPASIVAVFAGGFEPDVHESAESAWVGIAKRILPFTASIV